MAIAPDLMPAPAVRGNRDWAWCAGLLLACAVAMAAGALDGVGLAVTLVYLALALGARTSGRTRRRIPLLVLAGLCALLLALRRLPGFHNPLLVDHVQVSAGAPPFTLYANLDKAIAGIVLMGVFCAPIRVRADWLPMLRRTLPAARAGGDARRRRRGRAARRGAAGRQMAAVDILVPRQ